MKLLIALFLCIMSIQSVFSQQSGASDIEKKMKVLDVVERQNKLWIASNKGLFTINKATLNYFQRTTVTSPLLPANHIETLVLDAAQNLWIGTYDLALLKVTPDPSPVWTTIPYPTDFDGVPLPYYRIYSSAVNNQDGKIWLGTSNGLMNYDESEPDPTLRWEVIQTNCPHSDASIWDMEIKNGSISMAAYNLLTFDIANNRWEEHRHPDHPAVETYRPRLVQPDDNTLFYFSEPIPESISRLKKEASTWTSWSFGHGGSLPLLPNSKSLTAREAPNKRIYYNTNSNRLVYLDKNDDQWKIDDFVQENNIDINVIDHFFIDENGDFWLFEDYKVIHYNGSTTRTVHLDAHHNAANNRSNTNLAISLNYNENTWYTPSGDLIVIPSRSSDHRSNLSLNQYDPKQELDFTLFPNPTSDLLCIEKNSGTIEHLSIINSLGQTVLTLAPSQSNVNIRNLPNGIYWVIAQNKQSSQTISFIKKN